MADKSLSTKTRSPLSEIEKAQQEFEARHFSAPPTCTCSTKTVYIAGKLYTKNASTSYKNCKACNPGEQHD